jgi:hypothetical protein
MPRPNKTINKRSHIRRTLTKLAPGLLALVTLATVVPAATRHAHATSPIALGAAIQDWGLEAPCDAAAIDNFSNLTGRAPAIVMTYQLWGEYYNSFPGMGRCMDNVRARGGIGMITWEPWDGNASNPAYKLTAITRGDYDAYIRQYAQDVKAWGHPFFLRFAHEMNGAWYPWGVAPGNPNGNTPADYVAAWRHVHDIFAQVGATNALWVWSPNVVSVRYPIPASLYPGDAYVDWVGMDGYNEGSDPGAGDGGWTSLTNLFGPTYDTLTALTNKPLMIGEMASVETGGSKAAWITQGLLTDVPTRLPRVRAVIWFDKNKEADWRVDSSPAAVAAYRSVVASPLYQGQPDMSSTSATPPATNTPVPMATSPTSTSTAPALPINTLTATNTAAPPMATATNTAAPPMATATNTAAPPTATATNTAAPPTATATSTPKAPAVPATNTAAPTATAINTAAPPTATATNTPVPMATSPTSTSTARALPINTLTATNTAVPPTATATNTAATSTPKAPAATNTPKAVTAMATSTSTLPIATQTGPSRSQGHQFHPSPAPSPTAPSLPAIGPNPAPYGINGEWRFDEGSGATAVDSSGNGNSGTLRGRASWGVGEIGSGALNLDGDSGYVDVPHAVVNTSKSYTVAAWVNLANTSGWHTAVSIEGGNVSGFYLQYCADCHAFAFSVLSRDSSAATPIRAAAASAPATGIWYDLTGVYDATNRRIKLYINGALQSTRPFSSAWQASGHTLIGRAKWGGQAVDFWRGRISDVRLYNRALNQQEVQALAHG